MTLLNNTITTKKSKIKTDIGSVFLSIMILIVMLLILLDPVTYSKSVVRGLNLYFLCVLPGLLPFMFLIKQLTNQNVILKVCKPFNTLSKKLFGVNKNGFYAFLMSALSGYPIGAKITSDLYSQNQIQDNELLKTAIFSSTPGLIFVIGSVGGLMLKNIKLGLYIYFLNIFSVIISSFLINLFSEKDNQTKNIKTTIINKQQTLGSITQDTTISLLSVGFYIALFSLIIDLLTNLNIFSFIPTLFHFSSEKTSFFNSVMSGIVEMTNGLKLLSTSLSPLSFAFISSIISFSGISIIMQSLSFLSETRLKPYKFILGKLFQALICFLISFLFSLIIF